MLANAVWQKMEQMKNEETAKMSSFIFEATQSAALISWADLEKKLSLRLNTLVLRPTVVGGFW